MTKTQIESNRRLVIFVAVRLLSWHPCMSLWTWCVSCMCRWELVAGRVGSDEKLSLHSVWIAEVAVSKDLRWARKGQQNGTEQPLAVVVSVTRASCCVNERRWTCDDTGTWVHWLSLGAHRGQGVYPLQRATFSSNFRTATTPVKWNLMCFWTCLWKTPLLKLIFRL